MAEQDTDSPWFGRRDARMGPFDAVMYGIEGDPLLRTGIIAVIDLDRSPDQDQVASRTERLTRIFPRLRQRAIGGGFSPAPPRWETDPHFDLDYHIRWRRLPDGTGGDARSGVLAYASRMGEQDFDHSRPLWELAVLTDLPDGAAAMIFKIHHSVADGMGGIAMSAALFDLTPEPAELGPMPAVAAADPAGVLGRMRQTTAFTVDAVRETVVGAARAYGRGAWSLLTRPVQSARTGGRTAMAAATSLSPQGEPKSELMRERSLSSRFTAIAVPLDPLRQTARDADVTLNIVFIAAVAAAVGRYHRDHGEELPAFRVNMPVNQRKPGDEATGNHWMPARFLVPCGDLDPAARLHQLHGIVDEARQDPTLGLSDVLYKAMAALPDPVTERLAGSLMKGVDVAATNVPGPPIPVYLCGAAVTGMTAFAPKAGAAANIGLLTYNAIAHIGVNADVVAIPDVDEFTAYLTQAFADYGG
ncbi:hypothetical protein GOHSU_28_00470 [Gordonia hirsuta DSM 44140 = NBRC 16056]|uniref:diacylglycerol O-acyltransferase n=1 Tax=Gordonia hirsuta DSM 44140 = NBRC 16056 TaxID=1121927 RepID=L7LD65_9ACTN|nr:wax ester/triacylglycerol synthase domain-containing protein [Gordonia hirsuta]GAC57992.1 hypothetical protein GOHSU_28_00470 [Gordonia hirsuta DSM 44140 = NBRC 16056]